MWVLEIKPRYLEEQSMILNLILSSPFAGGRGLGFFVVLFLLCFAFVVVGFLDFCFVFVFESDSHEDLSHNPGYPITH